MKDRYFELAVIASILAVLFSIFQLKMDQLIETVKEPRKVNVTVETDPLVVQRLSDIKAILVSNDSGANNLLKEIRASTDLQLQASNQIYAANKAFIDWALQNELIEEVLDEK